MATPFPHVQITHLSRMGRRRSQSVMIPNTFSQDQTAGQSTARVSSLIITLKRCTLRIFDHSRKNFWHN